MLVSFTRPERLVAIVLFALLLMVTAAPSTEAAPSRKKAIWGPIERDGVSQFPIYHDLGVGIYQATLNWSDVATSRPANPTDPEDPAYAWPTAFDIAAAEGAKYGIRLSLMVMQTPGWANGGRNARWAPTRPQDYADFLTAASRRYPTVRLWMIWGEPTKSSNFQPLRTDNGRPLRGGGLRGPRKYAQMLDAAYVALKRVSRRNLVIGGNSYTVGTVRPQFWIRALRLSNGKRPRMDLYGHNPFSARAPTLAQRPLGGGYADFGDLDTLAGWLDRAFGKRLKLFLSEYSLPTDHQNWEFNFWVTRKVQARWIERALTAARGWSRIYTFGYLGLYDDDPRPDAQQVERGLLERDGTRKPAYDVFRRG
jgi:hypothetical protein